MPWTPKARSLDILVQPRRDRSPGRATHQTLASSGLSESCPKIGDVPKSPFRIVAALVPSAVAIAVRGSDEAPVTCKVGGSWKSAWPTTGAIWLRPIGAKSDESHVCSSKVEVIHLYVPNVVFSRLVDNYNLPAAPARCIRYSCGVQDELINQIGLSVLSEMMCPTAAGRMLVETSSLLLAARLAHAYLETELIRSPIPSRHRLDDGRLRRVLAYVEEHLAEDITVADLADVACLSIFHFTRAFAATMGVLRIATSANGGWRAPRQ